ncbi:hypothetical protein GCM10023074_44880 [Microbispora amethystogenes]|uniref:Uncharacterized protein n=1 Tax=Microbispora amethystogenes TaxID=1427754 RepID=A0ABQ4FJ56_9ACTN|nr:hypothetical protein Mam01_50200 [Microbispora amethystogenes]
MKHEAQNVSPLRVLGPVSSVLATTKVSAEISQQAPAEEPSVRHSTPTRPAGCSFAQAANRETAMPRANHSR